jgi:hypothetical protein
MAPVPTKHVLRPSEEPPVHTLSHAEAGAADAVNGIERHSIDRVPL